MFKIGGKRKYTCNYDYFESIDSEEKAYWLGFMLADGCVMHHRILRHLKTCDSYQDRYLTQLSLSIKDYDHLIKFSNSLNSTYPINIYKTSTGHSNKEYGRILIEDKKMFDDLNKYGVIQNKSLKEKFPYMVKEKYYVDIVRGIFDADGCLSSYLTRHNTKEYEFNINGTKEMLYSIKEILGDTSNNVLMKRHKERNNNNYTLKHGGNQITFKYMNILYKNANIYLNRKYKKYLELKQLIDGRV